MDVDAPSKSQEPAIRKGRRGLARKKTAHCQSEVISSTTTHNTSVYSSAVSRGYHSILGEISSAHDHYAFKSSESTNLGVNKTNEIAHVSDTRDELCEKVTELSDRGKFNQEESDDVILQEEINLPSVSGPDALRSPTPPPTSDGSTQPKRRRMNKKLTSALKALNKAKGDLNPSTPYSNANRKRKFRFHQLNTSPFPLDDCSPVKKVDILVKVRYLSNVHRLQLKLTDQFHNLLTHLSREIGQGEQHLSLYLNDQVLPLSKTPKEVGLTVADIIECHCIKDVKGSERNEPIALNIQCSNSKRKTEINVTMRQTFEDILKKYAEQAGINASSYSFCFDGEDVGPKDTPLSLEMEDGDSMDLVPASEPGSRSRTAWQNSVVTIM